MQELVCGILGVLIGVVVFRLGCRRQEPPTVPKAPVPSREQQQEWQRSRQELANFYAYDGTVQEDTAT